MAEPKGKKSKAKASPVSDKLKWNGSTATAAKGCYSVVEVATLSDPTRVCGYTTYHYPEGVIRGLDKGDRHLGDAKTLAAAKALAQADCNAGRDRPE